MQPQYKCQYYDLSTRTPTRDYIPTTISARPLLLVDIAVMLQYTELVLYRYWSNINAPAKQRI